MTDMLIRKPDGSETDAPPVANDLEATAVDQTRPPASTIDLRGQEAKIDQAQAKVDKRMDEAKAKEHRILGIDDKPEPVVTGRIESSATNAVDNPRLDTLNRIADQPGPAVVTAEVLDADAAANGTQAQEVPAPKGLFGKLMARLAGDKRPTGGEN